MPEDDADYILFKLDYSAIKLSFKNDLPECAEFTKAFAEHIRCVVSEYQIIPKYLLLRILDTEYSHFGDNTLRKLHQHLGCGDNPLSNHICELCDE